MLAAPPLEPPGVVSVTNPFATTPTWVVAPGWLRLNPTSLPERNLEEYEQIMNHES